MKAILFHRFVLILFFTLLFAPKAKWSNAQSINECAGKANVDIRVFPIRPGNAALEVRVAGSVRSFLCSINAGIPALNGVEINDPDTDILFTATTLHPTYKILLIPVVPPIGDTAFQIRGIHLNHPTENNLQLVLSLNQAGEIVKAEVVDDAEREANWEATRKELSERLPNGEEMLQLIKRLEDTYNREAYNVSVNGAQSMDDLAELLEEATINVSKLKDGSPESISYLSHRTYINELVRLIQEAESPPRITYEWVHIYPHRDTIHENGTGSYDEALRYRVTLIQHWMFAPGEYLDTDFLSLDIDVRPRLTIKTRNAGRGSFTLSSEPAGIQITELNGVDTRDAGLVTPFTDLINAPWQNHYLTLTDSWYETRYLEVKPDAVLNHADLFIEMVHREGLIDLTLLPASDEASIKVEDEAGNLVDASIADGKILVPKDQLQGKPELGEAISNDYASRDVRLVIERPSYQPIDTTITLPGPEEFPVSLLMKKNTGELIVTSTPSPSNVFIDEDFVGTTPLEIQREATLDDEPTNISANNNICYPGKLTQDCVLHIPSEAKDVLIQQDGPTEVHFDLERFVVRNLTKTASFNVRLNQKTQSDAIVVDVSIEDKNGRNRPYIVEFSLQDVETEKEHITDLGNRITQCTAEQNKCLGKGVRPGAFSMDWDAIGTKSQAPDNAIPVLTLRRRGTCWPCVFVPVAAGVAGAFIIPRTGSGETGTIQPPPRPDGTSR